MELFASTINLDHRDRFNGTFHVNVTRKVSDDCVGNLETHICTLRPAIVRYKLQLDSGIVSFFNNSWRDDAVLSPTYVSPHIEILIPPGDRSIRGSPDRRKAHV